MVCSPQVPMFELSAVEPVAMDVPAAPPLSHTDVLAVIAGLNQNMATLATMVNTLVADCATIASSTTHDDGLIQKPAEYDGDDMEGACMFISAFCIWVGDQT